MSEADFVDTLPPDATLESTPSPEPAVLKEVVRAFELLGVRSFLASVVDMAAMRVDHQWTISDTGSFTTASGHVQLENLFANASSMVAQLATSDTDMTLTQQLNPQRWRFAWRSDVWHAVIGEAEFQGRRDSVIDLDIALLRLVCGMGMQGGRGAIIDVTTPVSSVSMPKRERRLRPRGQKAEPQSQVVAAAEREPVKITLSDHVRRPGVALSMLLVTSILTGWLALDAVPQVRESMESQQQDLSQHRTLALDTMTTELSAAMASGDYGHVQAVLSSFATLGYFSGALVANSRDRVVAMAGRTEQLRIGDSVPASLAKNLKAHLKLGSQDYGQLTIIPNPLTPAPTLAPLMWAAWSAFVASTLAAILFVWRLRPR